MPPRKPRQSEPAPSPAAPLPTTAAGKKGRTSLPARSSSPPKKLSHKRKAPAAEISPTNAKRGKAKTVSPVKKKVKLAVEVEVEEEEEQEEIEEQVENTPAKPSKPTVEVIVKAARKSAAGSSKAKNVRRNSSKGEDKIGEIYAAGIELASDTSVQKRADTIATTMDKLEKQLSIPVDQLKKLCHDRTSFLKTINDLHIPIREIFHEQAQFQKSLENSIVTYEKLPIDAQEILAIVDKAQKAAVESGLKVIHDSQDFTSLTRSAKRFVAWSGTR